MASRFASVTGEEIIQINFLWCILTHFLSILYTYSTHEAPLKQILKASNTLEHHGLASTLRMRTAISPRQRQPRTAVSAGFVRPHQHSIAVGWRLKGCSAVKGGLRRAFSPISDGYAMLMRPNKAWLPLPG